MDRVHRRVAVDPDRTRSRVLRVLGTSRQVSPRPAGRSTTSGRYHRDVSRTHTNMDPITVLDLFAGCGGLTEGFHQFRPNRAERPVFRSVGAVEWDASAAASYAMNFGKQSPRERHFAPPKIFCRDIAGWVPEWGPGKVDVVVGGPPCQGFSGLNRNKVRAERNQLWLEFIRVVIAIQPRVFVIENVDRFVRSSEFADLKQRMGNGDLSNYSLVAAPGTKADDTDQVRARRYLLNAADYGSPQARRRAIVIGVRADVDLRTERMQYPEPTHLREALKNQATLQGLEVPVGQRAWATIDTLFGDACREQPTATALPKRPLTHVDDIGKMFAGPYKTSELHVTRTPEPLSVARYRAIPPGGNRKDLRGRYLCRFDDSSEIILHKEGRHRDDSGELSLFGTYNDVINGKRGPREFRVRTVVQGKAADLRGSGRSGVPVHRVVVEEGERKREATLEYLSTDVWDGHDTGSGDVMGRLRLGSPSVTIRTEFFKPEKGRYLHPTRHRPITHYEAAVLQGFPEDFRWCGSKSEIARQIGNAVPIPLGKKIAESIYTYLRPAGG